MDNRQGVYTLSFELRDVAAQFVADYYSASPKTQRIYRDNVERVLCGYLEGRGITDLLKVGPAELRDYLIHESERTYMIGRQVRRQSPTTINKRFETAKTFFGWCVDQDYLTANPMLKVKRPRLPCRIRSGYTKDELGRLLMAASKDPGWVGVRDRAMILVLLGIVRKDIRSSFGISETAADGVPLTIRLTVVDTKNGCKPLPGATLYLWHCDRAGNYSLYSAGVTGENYLRGVQVADGNGLVTFDTIFPGCYSGRWPHAHFEVFPSLQAASTSRNATITSQLALPEDVCQTVYAGAGYETSARNLSRITLKTDNVFSDGWVLQMATVTGDATSGYTADLAVGV